MDCIQENWELIRDEGLTQLKYGQYNDVKRKRYFDENDISLDIDGWVMGWTGNPNWLNYGLIYDSIYMKNNTYNCPITTKLLKECGLNITMCGFSVLKPKSGIPPHQDEVKSKSTVLHLGLSIQSSGQCILIVDKVIFNHNNGKVIQFDDSLIHSAFNGCDEDRLILYIKTDN